MRVQRLICAIFVLLSAPAWAGDDLNRRVDTIIQRWEGEWMGSYPGAFAKQPEKDSVPAWAVIKRVDAPAFGKRVLYKEIRADGPKGKILRQRLMAFSDDPERALNYMTFYPIMDAAQFERADLHPEKVRDLKPTDLKGFPPGCRVNIIGDKGVDLLTATKDNCVFRNPQTDTSSYVQFQIVVAPIWWSFFEAGHNVDGDFVSGSKAPGKFTRIQKK